jgi:hypothetical protein
MTYRLHLFVNVGQAVGLSEAALGFSRARRRTTIADAAPLKRDRRLEQAKGLLH